MKRIFEKFAIFTILTIIISGFAACGGKVEVSKNPVGENSANVPNKNLDQTARGANSAVSPTSETASKSDSATGDFPPAPAAITNAEFKLIDGKTFKLGEEKGSVILFNLWATWCGPCRGEMPELVALQDKFRDKKFKIVGLDVDNEPEDEVKEFAAKMKLNYEIGWGEENVVGEFIKFSKFSGIPQSFLVDRQGRLRGVFAGGGGSMVEKIKSNVEKVVNE